MKKSIGIRNESKSPRETRVPVTPNLAKKLMDNNALRVVVQHSEKRIFKDVEYELCGVDVADSLTDCSVIFGIKEISLNEIEVGKTYVFFSHTHKGQPYNMPMLRTLMEKKCTLIDYERIRDERGHRVIAFGYYAGLVGMINTLWALGERYKRRDIETPFVKIKQAFHYKSLVAARRAIQAIGDLMTTEGLPDKITPLTVGIVGRGRVSKGAQEIMNLLPVQEITPAALLQLEKNGTYSGNTLYKIVFQEHDIAAPINPDKDFMLRDYYKCGETYGNIFEQYVAYLSVVVNGIYWEKGMPRLISSDFVEKLYGRTNHPKLTIIGDITCDPGGSIEFMHAPTDVEHPVFIYNPFTREHTTGLDGEGIAVMAVDILPSELPRDASENFSELLEEYIIPIVHADYSGSFEQLVLPAPVKKAVILLAGELTPAYQYLQQSLDD